MTSRRKMVAHPPRSPADLDAAWPLRVGSWLQERFPPVVYTVLVVLFHASAVAVAGALGGGGGYAPAAAVVVWLFFLHLRIFDEHKDYARDRAAYPDRVLSRGVVTLPMLARLGAAVVLAQAALALSLGRVAFAVWAGAFLFSVAMRYEFGVGAWLERHIVAYALTHNPVVAGLALFLWAATGAPWHPAFLWYVAMASVGSLAFEIGRKTRLPGEEHAGVPSYTTELGQRRSRALLAGLHLGTGACACGLALALHGGALLSVALGLGVAAPGLLTALGQQPAKRVELGASLSLLVSFLALGALGLGAR